MECQRCGFDIPAGEVFCPRCGEEVQLVPDYNSLEYMIRQKEAETELRERERQERMRQYARQERKAAELKRKKRTSAIWITVSVILFLAVLAVASMYFIRYKQDNSFKYQYNMALETYKAGDYAAALPYAEKALELNPESDDALLLLAESKIHNSDPYGGIDLLLKYIEKHPDSIDAYALIISIYEQDGNNDKILELMNNCRNDIILKEFAAYIPSDIQFVTEPGEYTSIISVEIACSGGTVYYTTDGSIPDQNSMVYTEPIELIEGNNFIQAICYSSAGVNGEAVSAEYSVVLAPPDAPFVTPQSGEYESGTEITVVVPDGCEAYYVFDGIASESGNLYDGPIIMPEGEHIFSVIVIDQNGKHSYPSSETYVVE